MPGPPRGPLSRGSGAASAGVPDAVAETDQVVQHLVDETADRARHVLAPVSAIATQLAVEEEGQQVESSEEQPEQGTYAVGVVGPGAREKGPGPACLE